MRSAPRLRIHLLESHSSKGTGIEKAERISNYYVGSQSNWHCNISNYARVKYAGVYSGIDWIVRGSGRDLEYDFVVAPGADPAAIRMEFAGANRIRSTHDGDLIIQGQDFELVQRRPLIYQDFQGTRKEVEGDFVVLSENRVAIRVGAYDPGQPLIIDPVLSYSTIIGGTGTDLANGIAVDSSGSAYVTGNTTSYSTFPGSGYRDSSAPESFAFVYKLNAAGSAISYSALIGGNSLANSTGMGIAVDSTGNAYATGWTTAVDFPVTQNAFQSGPAPPSTGSQHGFVLSLNATGSVLRYSTYLRGNFSDFPSAIKVDASSTVYVAGYTNSTNFPTTPGAFQTTAPSTTSGFVTKLNSTGTGLLFSTYLGGPGSSFSTSANGIAIDTSGNSYVVGTTQSSNFPTTPGAFETDTTGIASGFGFLTKLNNSGTGLVYSSLITGGLVSLNGVAVDSSGASYVAGTANFLNYSGLVSIGNHGAPDVLALELNPAGSAAVYMVTLRGSFEDHGTGVAIDSSGNTYISGWSNSTDFPQLSPVQASVPPSGVTPAVIAAKLDPTGALVYSTYLGGQNNGDKANGIAVDANAIAYLAGRAGSVDFPTTPGAAGKTVGDGFDTFVAALSTTSGCTFSLTPSQASFSAAGGQNSVAVNTTAGCNWVATSSIYWIAVTSGASGTGAGTVDYSVQPNVDVARSASLSVAGLPFTISQANGCTYSLSAPSASVPSSGAQISVNLTTGGSCPWTISTLPSWIQSLSGGPPEGSFEFLFNVTSNTAGPARSVTLTIAGLSFVISQNGGFTCTFSINPTSRSYGYLRTTDEIDLTTTSTCAWLATSDSPWLHITDVASGLGDDPVMGIGLGHVNIGIDTNSTNAGRLGTVTAGGIAFTAHQVATPLPYNAGIFRSGFFWLEDVDGNQQFNAPPDRAFAFGGIPGDIPISGDWNGSGSTKVGIYRPSNGLFILDYDGDGQFTAADKAYDLGVGVEAGDIPLVGDWNGDGKTKVGLFRQGFFWILDTNGDGVFQQGVDQTFAFGGVAGDLPVVGDWNGDGKSKLGLFRQGFFWILDYNGNGLIDNVNQTGGDKAFAYGGIAGDVPVVGDWNGDGKSKVGVFRDGFFWVLDANGNYQFDGTGTGQDLAFPFGGISGDKPVVGKW